MRLNDSTRRGLRTAIDVTLSAFSSGLILLLINIFKEPDLTVEQFTVVALALTPVLSSIKNAVEDRTGRSLLVSKVRPQPDPVDGESATVEPTEAEVFGDEPEIAEVEQSEQVLYAPVPKGYVLVAVKAKDVSAADDVVGFTK